MKTLLVFVLVGFVALVIFMSMRKKQSDVVRRRFPGPNLRTRNENIRNDNTRYDGTDTTFMTTAAMGGSDSHHGHGSHHADCAPSHDSGASCDVGGGGDGGGGGGGGD